MKKTYSFFTAILFVLLLAFSFANAQITLSGSTGGLIDGTYATFTGPGPLPNTGGGVFDALNTVPQVGSAIVISVTGNTAEPGTFALNAGGWATISVTPSGGAWTLSGSLAGNGLFQFNGADNVTIDGLNTGGNSLTISNTNSSTTSETSTIRFIGGATSNTVTNCTVLGSFSGSTFTNGGNIFFSTDALTPNGNDNNTISNCNIGPAGTNTPSKLIYGNGSITTAGIRNSGNLIDNNNLFDFFRAAGSCSGIHILNGNDLWTISNNRIYQTAPRVFTVTSPLYAGININQSQTTGIPGSYTITNNIIGFGSNTQTGTTTISGLGNLVRLINLASVSPTVATSVQGNTISGINTTSSGSIGIFMGILCGSTDGLINVGDVAGNNIGSVATGGSTIVVNASTTVAGPFPVIGIWNFSFQNTNTSNNKIGNITIQQGAGVGTTTGFRGILINTDTGRTAILNENEIALINNTLIGNNIVYGIQTSLPDATIFRNVIRDLSSNGNGLNSVHVAGIHTNRSTGVNSISENSVHNLTNASSISGAIWGIFGSFPVTANEIKKNYVYALDAITTATTYALVGIENQGTGSANVYNNMITLGLKPSGAPITTAVSIRGIEDISTVGTNNYYYNSVYTTGSGVDAGGSNSYSMFSSSTATREFIDNIFWNDRSNAVTGGTAHYAVTYAGVGPNPPGLTSNYNDLIASGTDGILGFYDGANQPTLAAWQAATGQDANSSSVTVNFSLPSSGDLHLTGASVGDLNLTGTPIAGITTDIDGVTRDAFFPYMGADESLIVLPVELAAFTSTISNRDVTLNWTTVTETNNSGFDVERSSNGEWSKIGNVTGNGTTTTPMNYSFTDRGLNSGSYNYRLKQIDYNGNFAYFNLSGEVSVGIPTTYNLSQNYPNPFNPSTTINFDLPFDSKVSIKLFDVSGKEVATLVNDVKTAGYYTVKFNGSNLSSGIYFYRISAESNGNNFVSSKKMTLVK